MPSDLEDFADALLIENRSFTDTHKNQFRDRIDSPSKSEVAVINANVTEISRIVTGSLESVIPGTLSKVNIGYSRIVAPALGQHLLIQNSTPLVAGRLHIEPNGNIERGTTSKLDLMLTPYNDINPLDPSYSLANMYCYIGDGDGCNGQNGVAVISAKAVGDYFGVFPSINFGFSDDNLNGGGVMKVMYFDTSDTAWRKPMMGAWRQGRHVNIGDYMQAGSKLYVSVDSGTTGSIKPSHTSGTVSDGSINWTFVRDYTGGANFRPCVIFGDRDDMPKFGMSSVRLQLAKDAAVWNGAKVNFLSNTGVPIWSAGSDLNTTEYSITNLGAGTGKLRFSQLGWAQWNGLAYLLGPKASVNLSTTPDISRTSLLRLDNTGATVITSFLGGTAFQVLYVVASNGNTTIKNSASIQLAGGRDKTLVSGECLQFVMSSSGSVAFQVIGETPVSSAIQPPGTTGAITQNATKGRVNFAAGAISLVVTNSFVDFSSIITLTKASNDGFARLGAVVVAIGSFTIFMDVAPAVECSVNYSIER